VASGASPERCPRGSSYTAAVPGYYIPVLVLILFVAAAITAGIQAVLARSLLAAALTLMAVAFAVGSYHG
jgi:hypothetical protein